MNRRTVTDTDKQYAAMLSQALQRAKPQAQEAQSRIAHAREGLRMRDRAFWKWGETEGERYAQDYLKAIEEHENCSGKTQGSPTTQFLPLTPQTDSIDRQHMADVPTLIQDWPQFARETGLLRDALPPITESHPRITRTLSGKLGDYFTHWIQYHSSSRSLPQSITQAVEIYTQERNMPPLLIEISKAAYGFLEIMEPEWVKDSSLAFPGPQGAIPIACNRLLETHAVQASGN